MLLKTILNRIQKYPGFVYVVFRLLGELGALRLEALNRSHLYM